MSSKEYWSERQAADLCWGRTQSPAGPTRESWLFHKSIWSCISPLLSPTCIPDKWILRMEIPRRPWKDGLKEGLML